MTHLQKTIQDIFKQALESQSLFKDKSVLTITHQPNEILHRDNEIITMSKILAVSLKGDRPSNIFIYGPTGTGKTLVTRYVLDNLSKMADMSGAKVHYVYVNAKLKKVSDTEYRLLSYIANELGEKIPYTGLPTDVVYERLFKKLEELGGVVILAIDEIDALVNNINDQILYTLTRINQDLKNTHISLIGISNNLNFTDSLDARVKSSLSEEEILFAPYNALQLKDIIERRIKDAFVDGVVDSSAVSKCAALAAQEHGDARKALDLLRVAGEIAERNGDMLITDKHVDLAQKKIDYDRVIESVKSLPSHTKLVLYAILHQFLIENKSKVYTGDVYDSYHDFAISINKKPLTQRRVSDLIGELDVLGIINAKQISKGRYGRTREIRPNNPKETYEKAYELIKNDLYIA